MSADLVMFLGGLVLAFGCGSFTVMALFDTSGRWWVTALGGAAAVATVVGLLLVARALGIGFVGAP